MKLKTQGYFDNATVPFNKMKDVYIKVNSFFNENKIECYSILSLVIDVRGETQTVNVVGGKGGKFTVELTFPCDLFQDALIIERVKILKNLIYKGVVAFLEFEGINVVSIESLKDKLT